MYPPTTFFFFSWRKYGMEVVRNRERRKTRCGESGDFPCCSLCFLSYPCGVVWWKVSVQSVRVSLCYSGPRLDLNWAIAEHHLAVVRENGEHTEKRKPAQPPTRQAKINKYIIFPFFLLFYILICCSLHSRILSLYMADPWMKCGRMEEGVAILTITTTILSP